MNVTIREARADDCPFLAWVMLTAARSHRRLCFWDLAFPGPEPQRLDYITAVADLDPSSFTHYSGFLVAEANGQPVAALCGYDPALKGLDGFVASMTTLLEQRDWSPDHQRLLSQRIAPAVTCGPEPTEGAWTIEWVATKPEARGKGVARSLLLEILERGRSLGFKKSQIAYLIGNTPASTAYERVGFEYLDEQRDTSFEAAFGSPGIARMLRDL
ncbi:MAG: ribosomal protein S18 acetylase RimI-like enzyme [Hyphomicrobiaceae bacterium]|jgi:ribosomal protein S18 acetylase RimI-like enzyme